MKAVILAGGLGTRLSEETARVPKPMVEIGGKPILWHIMKIYAAHGITDFVLCLGYKGYSIKEYFANYFLHHSDVTFDIPNNRTIVHQNSAEPWKVTLVDTGENTMTGGRLRRVRDYVAGEDFCMTYGDGVGDVDITASIAFHKAHGLLSTMTVTQPPGRFGVVEMDGDRVTEFQEKPHGESGWINAGFFVLSPKVIDYIDDDNTTWEREPMERLAAASQMCAWRHHGFWRPMDALRDKIMLEQIWSDGKAPWKVW
jgi:glucose-1-phosphate cytidylyltransferase